MSEAHRATILHLANANASTLTERPSGVQKPLFEPGPSDYTFRALSVELAPGEASLYLLCKDGKVGYYMLLFTPLY